MRILGGKRKIKSNSALAIAAGCAVVFMFVATIVSTILYKQRMDQAVELLAEAKYSQYDSYVVLIASEPESDFWQDVYEAAKNYGKENNVYVDMISNSVDQSYTKAELIEMAIESECDGILVEGDESEETVAMISKAKSKGIAVFTLGSDVSIDSRISYIGPNSYTIANLYASSLVANVTEPQKVMILGSSAISETSINFFLNNIQAALSEMELPNGGFEFDVRKVENSSPFATEEYIQNLFKDKENELPPVVICLDENTTASFYQAMIDYNKVGQVLLFGSNTTSTILTGIKQRVIANTVYVDGANIGTAAAKAYIEYRDFGYVSDYINVDAKVIDSSNIDELLEEVADE